MRYLASSGAPVKYAGRPDRLQHAERRHRRCPTSAQEIFEQANAKGAADRRGLPRTRATRPARLAGAEGIDAALKAQQPRRADRPGDVAGVADRPGQRRPLHRRRLRRRRRGAAIPSITVPMGDVHGLPVGIAFMGTAWSEARLIELAYAYEQASKARTPPRFPAEHRRPDANAGGSRSARRDQPALAHDQHRHLQRLLVVQARIDAWSGRRAPGRSRSGRARRPGIR